MIARKVSSFPRISFQGGGAKTAPIEHLLATGMILVCLCLNRPLQRNRV
ncbi:Hypothetical protein BIBO2_2724 [Brucella sp. BO2]|nr:Hypothetical protein BIBO2_2724 [Brucella sp. BO2]